MISDWLVSQSEMFVPRGILNKKKIKAFKVKGEKRSDVHTKNKRKRKKIFPRPKASPKKLNKIEKLHQLNTSIVYLSNTTKAIISINECVMYIIVTPLFFSKKLLIVNGEFFLFLSFQHPGNVPTTPLDLQKKFRIDCFIIP